MNTARDIMMIDHGRLGFSLQEYRRRYALALEGMQKRGVDVLLVRTPENICYLTGFETPGYYAYHCLILSTDQDPVLVLRRIEETNIREFSWLADAVPVDDDMVPYEVTIATLKKRGLANKRIGIEEGSFFTPIEEYKFLIQNLPEATFINASGIVEQARVIKSDEEIKMMRRCAEILDVGMQAAVDAVRIGATEDDVAAEAHRVLVKNGSEYPSLPHFICAGERASVTHATWRGKKIEKGEAVFIELSATKHRYSAALLVCACHGEPSPRVRAVADASLAGLHAALDTIKPGVPCEAAYWALHGAIEKAGFGQYHHHRAGYSIGVNFPPDWGEGQILSLRKGEKRLLEPNMTFHIIPDIYIYREIGVCFSATVRVTENGCEDLSKFPRRFYVN